jgi:hypothetical protein
MVLWCDETVSETAVRDVLSVARCYSDLMEIDLRLRPSIHILGVEKLLPRVRDELLRCICDKKSTKLLSSLLLIFGGPEGCDSFQQFEAAEKQNIQEKYDYSSNFWAVQSTGDSGDINAKVFVVCGGSGVGKTRFVLDQISQNHYLRFVVHEGFSPNFVIDRFNTSITKSDTGILYLYFDITQYAQLNVFSRFLHNLLVLGLILDELRLVFFLVKLPYSCDFDLLLVVVVRQFLQLFG